MQTKVLVVGAKGQLGQDMALVFRSGGYAVEELDFPDIDITDPKNVENAFGKIKPGVVINCAAYTAVDACEENRETAFAVNAKGAGILACAAEAIGAEIVHISTDYVFDGSKKGAYVENDEPCPRSVYGESKLEGERQILSGNPRHYILRIAWLYGNRGANFVKTIRRVAEQKARENESIKVVDDQIGSPTYTMEVCRQVAALLPGRKYGLYHATAEGECSWYGFAKAIVEAYGIGVELLPCTTEEFPRPAPRPANSVLENNKLKDIGLNVMKNWHAAFEEYLREQKGLQPVS